MNIFSKIADYLFPRRCIFCNLPIYGAVPYCDSCAKVLPFAEDACSKCGKTSCVCEKNAFCFSGICVVFRYEAGAANAIKNLKFREHISYAKPLGDFLYQKLITTDFYPAVDVIMPIPMTKKKLNKRGYNQTLLIAKRLSELSGIPVDNSSMKKIRDTKNQHDLSRHEREMNLKGAFIIASPKAVAGKTVLLCDDVYTTGATLDECARTLLNAGAKEVFCCAVATTIERNAEIF